MSHSMLSELQQKKPFSNPEEELYLSLIRTADMLARHVSQLLKQAGVSHAQYNVLRILRGAGEEGLPCGEISARLITRDPDVTRLLDRLDKRHLVERGRSTGDRRVVSTKITDQGLALLAELDAPILKAHQAQFGFLKETGIRQIINQLTLVRERLD
jgi:DNA-binding MarR family transcriptional regulator